MWPLKVFTIVPLDYTIFQLTYPVGITEDLKHSIFHVRLLTIPWVSQNRICWGCCQLRWKPLNRVDIYHTLHIEQIYSYFNGVSLANLIDWLHIRPIYQLWYLQVVKLKWIFELLQLLKLFLLVFVHPEDSAIIFRLNIHFIVSTVFSHVALTLVLLVHATLLWIRLNATLAPLSKFILETRHKAFIDVIILYLTEHWSVLLSLVKHFAYEDAVYSDTTFASKVHYAWISIALLKKEMFIV